MAVLSCIHVNTVIFFIHFVLSQTSFSSINIFLRLIPVFTHLFLSLKQSRTSNKLHCTFWKLLLQQKFLLLNLYALTNWSNHTGLQISSLSKYLQVAVTCVMNVAPYIRSTGFRPRMWKLRSRIIATASQRSNRPMCTFLISPET